MKFSILFIVLLVVVGFFLSVQTAPTELTSTPDGSEVTDTPFENNDLTSEIEGEDGEGGIVAKRKVCVWVEINRRYHRVCHRFKNPFKG